MELNNFARIGKGVLTKAIGLQKNYTEIYEKAESKLNENKSKCLNCPIHNLKSQFQALGIDEVYNQLHTQCKGCSTAVWEDSYQVSVKYINEKNRYGYQPTLKSNAIKLFITYHFLQPDTLGFIKNVSLKDLSLLLGCTVATIKANNDALSSYGYCYICDSGIYNNHVNILLPEYKNYHKPAHEGGRGYINMSMDLLKSILTIEELNTLRLNIKGIIDVDNASIFNVQEQASNNVTTSYRKLRGFLPSYCKRNVIRGALEKSDSIFDFSFNDVSITFKIKEKFSHKTLLESLREQSLHDIDTFIKRFNDVLDKAGSDYFSGENPETDALLNMFQIDNSFHSYPALTLTNIDMDNLAAMCVQYNCTLVKQAISTIYNTYVIRNQSVRNFGALVRSIIRSKHVSFEIAS